MGKLPDEMKEKILNAAVGLFRDKGYMKTSMDDIAHAVGLTKGGIYYYVKKKEHLLVEMHYKIVDTFLHKFAVALESESDFSMKIYSWVKTHVAIMHDFEPYIKIYFKELDNIPEKESIAIQKKSNAAQLMLRNVIVEGIEKKQVRSDIDPQIASFLILGMLNWIPQWYRPTGPRTVSEIADHVNKILNSGIVDADHLRKREKSEGKHEVFDTSNERNGELDQKV
ncbi:MAG TPA: TetR/AcrR family transcriptional regulator [Bacteroidota bacterium]|nr:TetR/AcrR family transcriptional regulator [Bacteroidota bacterium]